MNILHVTSSSRGSASYSNRVASEVLGELVARNVDHGAEMCLRLPLAVIAEPVETGR